MLPNHVLSCHTHAAQPCTLMPHTCCPTMYSHATHMLPSHVLSCHTHAALPCTLMPHTCCPTMYSHATHMLPYHVLSCHTHAAQPCTLMPHTCCPAMYSHATHMHMHTPTHMPRTCTHIHTHTHTHLPYARVQAAGSEITRRTLKPADIAHWLVEEQHHEVSPRAKLHTPPHPPEYLLLLWTKVCRRSDDCFGRRAAIVRLANLWTKGGERVR